MRVSFARPRQDEIRQGLAQLYEALQDHKNA